MPVLTYQLRDDGLYLHTDRGLLMALTPYTARAVRVRCTLRDTFSTRESLMVTARPAAIPFTVAETPERLVFATDELVIEIDRQTAAFTYRDQAGGC